MRAEIDYIRCRVENGGDRQLRLFDANDEEAGHQTAELTTLTNSRAESSHVARATGSRSPRRGRHLSVSMAANGSAAVRHAAAAS